MDVKDIPAVVDATPPRPEGECREKVEEFTTSSFLLR